MLSNFGEVYRFRMKYRSLHVRSVVFESEIIGEADLSHFKISEANQKNNNDPG